MLVDDSESSDAAPKRPAPAKKIVPPASSPALTSGIATKRKALSSSDTDSSGTGVPPPSKRIVPDRPVNQSRPGPSIQQQKRERAPTPTDSSSDEIGAPSTAKAIPQTRLEPPARPRPVLAVPSVNRAPSPSDDDSESDVQPAALARQTIIVEERISIVEKQSVEPTEQRRLSQSLQPVIEVARAGKKRALARPSHTPAVLVASLSPPAVRHVAASSSMQAERVRAKPVVYRAAELELDLDSAFSDVQAERIRPKPVVHRRVEAEVEFLPTTRSESRSPSEPPESYVGTSAQIYIEQRYARQTDRQTSSSASKRGRIAQEPHWVAPLKETVMPREPSPDQRPLKQTSPKRSSLQMRRRTPSLVESSDNDDILDVLVPAQSVSSLKARKTTAKPRQEPYSRELRRESRNDPVVEADTRMLEDKYSKKPFPRLSRSSSDEEESVEEETAITTGLTASKRSPTPERNHEQMDGREHSFERFVPEESNHIYEEHLEQEFAILEARDIEENPPSPQQNEFSAAKIDPVQEDIPVPAYASRSPSVSL